MNISKKILFLLLVASAGNISAMQGLSVEESEFRNVISEKLDKKLQQIGIIKTQSISQALPGTNPTVIFDSMYKYDEFYFNSLNKKLKIIRLPVHSTANQEEIQVYYLLNLRPLEEFAKGKAGEEALCRTNLRENEVKQRENNVEKRESNVEKRESNVKELEAQLEAKKIDIKQMLEYSANSTFWRRHPYILGTSCFLTGGLLCGLSAYYGHAKIDTFLNYVSSFWRKN